MVKDNKLDKCENFLNLEDILDVTNFTSTKYAISDFFFKDKYDSYGIGNLCRLFFSYSLNILKF